MKCKMFFRSMFLILLAVPYLVIAQSPVKLSKFFKQIPIQQVPESLYENLDRYTSRSSTQNFWVVEIPELENLIHANSLEFGIENKNIGVNLADIEVLNNNEFIWASEISGEGSHITLAKTEIGLTGTLILENEIYKLEPLGQNFHLISLCNYSNEVGKYDCETQDTGTANTMNNRVGGSGCFQPECASHTTVRSGLEYGGSLTTS